MRKKEARFRNLQVCVCVYFCVFYSKNWEREGCGRSNNMYFANVQQLLARVGGIIHKW